MITDLCAFFNHATVFFHCGVSHKRSAASIFTNSIRITRSTFCSNFGYFRFIETGLGKHPKRSVKDAFLLCPLTRVRQVTLHCCSVFSDFHTRKTWIVDVSLRRLIAFYLSYYMLEMTTDNEASC